MPRSTLTREILQAALAGFQLDKQRIDAKIAEVQALLDGSSPTAGASASEEAPKKRRRKRSAAVRRRMAEAQKARWAKTKGEAVPPSPAMPEAPKAKRQISEEGMKRIIAATKKRWRKAKAAKLALAAVPKKPAAKKATPAAAKKSAPVKKAAAKKSATAITPAIVQASEQ